MEEKIFFFGREAGNTFPVIIKTTNSPGTLKKFYDFLEEKEISVLSSEGYNHKKEAKEPSTVTHTGKYFVKDTSLVKEYLKKEGFEQVVKITVPSA